jgi:hypothetical protein
MKEEGIKNLIFEDCCSSTYSYINMKVTMTESVTKHLTLE